MEGSATDLVLSDVHLEAKGASNGGKLLHTTFTFKCPLMQKHHPNEHLQTPPHTLTPQHAASPGIPESTGSAAAAAAPLLDADGDAIVPRRRPHTGAAGLGHAPRSPSPSLFIRETVSGRLAAAEAASCAPGACWHVVDIAHHGATALGDVGLQVWRGECLLVEWVLHAMQTGRLTGARTFLELGAGVGMAMVALASALSCPGASQKTGPQAAISSGGELKRAGSGGTGETGRGHGCMALLCTDSHGPSLRLAEANCRANLPCLPSSDQGNGMLAVACCGQHQQQRQHTQKLCQQPPSHHVKDTGCGGATAAPSHRVMRPHTPLQPEDGQAGTTRHAAVEVALRRLDWLDFAAYGSGQTAMQAVQGLLQDDEGGRSAPVAGAAGTGTMGHAEEEGGASGLQTPEVAASMGSGDDEKTTVDAREAFAWQESDLERLAAVDVILAGDVVYDETLTEAMLKAAAALMDYTRHARHAPRSDRQQHHGAHEPGSGRPGCPGQPGDSSCEPLWPRLYVALEKRWCFTLRDMDSRAPAFEHFLSLVHVHEGACTCTQRGPAGALLQRQEGLGQGGDVVGPACGDACGVHRKCGRAGKLLCGKRMSVADIPQHLQGYERGPDLELWELW